MWTIYRNHCGFASHLDCSLPQRIGGRVTNHSDKARSHPVLSSDLSADKPIASVILFVGAHGRLALSPRGIGWGEGNFLVRNRERFCREGFLVAVMDAPSDRPQGLWNFRTSVAHAEDIKYVIAELRKMFDIPVWLIGTSMGTVSAANFAARLKEGGPDGLVLTSTITKDVGDTESGPKSDILGQASARIRMDHCLGFPA